MCTLAKIVTMKTTRMKTTFIWAVMMITTIPRVIPATMAQNSI